MSQTACTFQLSRGAQSRPNPGNRQNYKISKKHESPQPDSIRYRKAQNYATNLGKNS